MGATVQDLARRKKTRELELLWRGAASFGDAADVFTGTFPTGKPLVQNSPWRLLALMHFLQDDRLPVCIPAGNYGPPQGFYFDWGNWDPPVQVLPSLATRVFSKEILQHKRPFCQATICPAPKFSPYFQDNYRCKQHPVSDRLFPPEIKYTLISRGCSVSRQRSDTVSCCDSICVSSLSVCWLQDNVCLVEINVQDRVEDFVKAAREMADLYRDTDVFWPMGTDFTYSNAFTWYEPCTPPCG